MGVNCYIYYNDKKEAFMVDPGLVHKKIDEFVENNQLIIQAILLTHGHGDHIMGVEHYSKLYNCPVYAHTNEREILENYRLNHSKDLGGVEVELRDVNYFNSKASLDLAGIKVQCIHSPGHSPGGVSYLTDEGLFSGDTLFKLGIGRYDLHGGDLKALEKSVFKLYNLADDTKVYPGHGVATTIGYEKTKNPYFRK